MNKRTTGSSSTIGFLELSMETRFTGSDLLEPGSDRILEKQFAKATAVLSGFEDRELVVRIIAPFAVVAQRMQRPGGMTSASNETELKTTIRKGITDNLVFKDGRDIFGSGRTEDPFRFRPDLVYHDAVHAYLAQSKIRWKMFQFWPNGNKMGDCVVTEDGRHLYFTAN